MNLSNRLKAVATLVCKDSRVIDVGCDHAYLDIYLTLYNNNSCIATDINKNALEIAKNNIKKYNLIIKNIGKKKLLLKFKYKFLILKLKAMLYYNTKNNWDYH